MDHSQELYRTWFLGLKQQVGRIMSNDIRYKEKKLELRAQCESDLQMEWELRAQFERELEMERELRAQFECDLEMECLKTKSLDYFTF